MPLMRCGAAQIAPRLAKLVAFAPAATKWSSVLISINAKRREP
jgi:hypothetical protein